MKQSLLIILFLNFFYSMVFSQESKALKDTNRNSGYFSITKISYSKTTNLKRELFVSGEGGSFGDLDTDGANTWSLHTINGFFISPSFSLGLGVGIEGHNNPNFNIIPLFLDARLYLSEDTETLYTYIDIGPTLSVGDTSKFRKGVLFNFGVGYKFPVSDSLFLVSDIFYSHKTVSFTDEVIGTSDDVIKANSVGLSLGVIF